MHLNRGIIKVILKKIILSDKGIMEILTKEEIDDLFSLDYHLKNVDYIFKNVFGK